MLWVSIRLPPLYNFIVGLAVISSRPPLNPPPSASHSNILYSTVFENKFPFTLRNVTFAYYHLFVLSCLFMVNFLQTGRSHSGNMSFNKPPSALRFRPPQAVWKVSTGCQCCSGDLGWLGVVCTMWGSDIGLLYITFLALGLYRNKQRNER